MHRQARKADTKNSSRNEKNNVQHTRTASKKEKQATNQLLTVLKVDLENPLNVLLAVVFALRRGVIHGVRANAEVLGAQNAMQRGLVRERDAHQRPGEQIDVIALDGERVRVFRVHAERNAALALAVSALLHCLWEHFTELWRRLP